MGGLRRDVALTVVNVIVSVCAGQLGVRRRVRVGWKLTGWSERGWLISGRRYSGVIAWHVIICAYYGIP